ncbi:MAG TPA: outer membrane lipoprotein carrier protein LolA [Prolixibacteraceae bacterium]|nr:outer membrane lipoprotein carrier protein LolA [Prolixibacteraceae bacterium]
MKKIILAILTIISLQSFSQSDAKAKAVLDKVSEKTRNYPSITASFDFTMQNNAAGLNETTGGNLILQKDKYKLTMSGVEIFCDGKTQWTYMREAQEVSINNAGSESGELLNPATVFTIYEKGFKNTYLGEFTNSGKKTCKIELLPHTVKEFSRLILEIDLSNYQIMNAKMYGTDDNEYTIKIKSMTTTTNYEPSTFIFDTKKNSNIEVIDMR